MDHSVGNESSVRTVPILYIVACGKPTPDGEMSRFEFSDQAPFLLCEPHGDGKPAPDADETGMFITTVIDRHHPKVLYSKARRCVSCNKPARELFHSGLPFLSPGPDATPDFKPFIWDTTVPICRSGGACDHHAADLAHTFARNAFPENEIFVGKICDC